MINSQQPKGTPIMSLTAALADIKADMIATETPVAKLVADYAEAYGLRQELLYRKIAENGWTRDRLRTNKDATSYSTFVENSFKKNIALACKKYKVSESQTQERTIRGEKYTIICRLSNARKRPYLAISHKDGLAYRISI